MRIYNFSVSGPNLLIFCSTSERPCLIMPLTSCRYLYPVQRYSQPKSQIVAKHTEFWTFLALPNFKRAVSPKSCSRLITPTQRHVTWKSFIRQLPLPPKLKVRIYSILSLFPPCGCAIARLCHSLVHAKIWRRSTPKGPKYGFLKKLIWLGMITPLNLWCYTGPKFTQLFRLTREESW